MAIASIDFHLPDSLNATEPPERRGIRRDQVRMMVLNKSTMQQTHDCFYNLEAYLQPGDLIVLNSSRTVPAVLKAKRKHNNNLEEPCEIRLARMITEDTWGVLIRVNKVKVGDEFIFEKNLRAQVIAQDENSPIKTIQFSQKGAALLDCIYSLGEPIRYEYIAKDWALDYYQTVYANSPGSVEMPSAGRAFSWELLFNLQQKGIKIAFIQLHTGLSYLLDDKWDHSPEKHPEKYIISPETMKQIQETKVSHGRVIAVGTTVVRALETAAISGVLSGWTDLYIKKDFQRNMVDGIITGLHEPKASHLELLSSFIQEDVLLEAYYNAMEKGYLWHEFGDMNLII